MSLLYKSFPKGSRMTENCACALRECSHIIALRWYRYLVWETISAKFMIPMKLALTIFIRQWQHRCADDSQSDIMDGIALALSDETDKELLRF